MVVASYSSESTGSGSTRMRSGTSETILETSSHLDGFDQISKEGQILETMSVDPRSIDRSNGHRGTVFSASWEVEIVENAFVAGHHTSNDRSYGH